SSEVRDLRGHPLLRDARARRDRPAAPPARVAASVPRAGIPVPAAALCRRGDRPDRGASRREPPHHLARIRSRRDRNPGLLPLAPPRLSAPPAPTLPRARVEHVADGALLVEYPEADEEEANRSAVALAGFLTARPPAGLRD